MGGKSSHFDFCGVNFDTMKLFHYANMAVAHMLQGFWDIEKARWFRIKTIALIWRRRWDSNPRGVAAYLISSQGRYDHFDTPPYRTSSLYQRSGKKSRIIFLPNQLQNLFQILTDAAVIFPAVRPQTGRAVLDPLFCIPEISPAPISQGIQGAVTEHAAKTLRISALVTGKIFTFPVLIKIIMAHGFLHSPLSHLF